MSTAIPAATPAPEPDCSKCMYRRDVPNSHHSRCAHPVVPSGPLVDLLAVLAGKTQARSYGITISYAESDVLGVRFNARGVKEGWANWPWNFHEVWLEACDGFKPKEEP